MVKVGEPEHTAIVERPRRFHPHGGHGVVPTGFRCRSPTGRSTSAFAVHPERINVLLRGALRASHGHVCWSDGNPTHMGELTDANAATIGQRLPDANVASVNYHYALSSTGKKQFRKLVAPVRVAYVLIESIQGLTQHLTEAMMSEDQTTDVPPNHLSIDPSSPFYNEEVLRRDVGIRFNGVEKTNVHEYNVAEGWVRVDVPTAKDRRGNPMVIKLSGTVEPYFRLAD